LSLHVNGVDNHVDCCTNITSESHWKWLISTDPSESHWKWLISTDTSESHWKWLISTDTPILPCEICT